MGNFSFLEPENVTKNKHTFKIIVWFIETKPTKTKETGKSNHKWILTIISM